MTAIVDEIAQCKAKLAVLEQREQNEINFTAKNVLSQRIIESTKTLNLLLLAQQGTFLFPDFVFLSGSVSHQLTRPPILLQTLHPNHISNSDAIRNSHSVPAFGAGNDSVSTFLADFVCRFFHDLGPCRDDQVVPCLRLFYFSPFGFCGFGVDHVPPIFYGVFLTLSLFHLFFLFFVRHVFLYDRSIAPRLHSYSKTMHQSLWTRFPTCTYLLLFRRATVHSGRCRRCVLRGGVKRYSTNGAARNGIRHLQDVRFHSQTHLRR